MISSSISRSAGNGRCHVRLLPLLLVLFTACGEPPPPPGVVARSTQGDVTEGELEGYILSLAAAEQRPAAGQELAAWRREKLEDLIIGRALEAEGRDLAPEEETRAALRTARESWLIELARQRRRATRAPITEDDLHAYYQDHPDEFGHSEQIRLRHIFRRVPRQRSRAERAPVRAEMEAMLASLRQGAHFGDLARTRSDSETARVNGLIGRLDRGQLDPALDAIVWNLEEGGLSEVVSTPVGFHIFLLEDRLETFDMPFEEAKDRIRRKLARQREEAARRDWLAELLARAGAAYHPEALDPSFTPAEAPLLEIPGAGDDLRVTLGDLRDLWARQDFLGRRHPPLEEQLESMVLNRLLLWEGREQEAGEGAAEASAALAEKESEVFRQAGRRRRFESWLAGLDDELLRQHYEATRNRYRSPRLYRLRLLTVDFSGGEEQPYRVFEQLQSLAGKLRAGTADFAAEARRRSSDPSAPRGGDPGTVRLDVFIRWAGPQAQKIVPELAVGEVSEPILVERYDQPQLKFERQGYMLVKVEDILESRQQPFEEVRQEVARSYSASAGSRRKDQIRRAILESVAAEILAERLG